MYDTVSPHEAAAREFERMRKVEAFIRHELAGETRVAVSMDPRCEVSVVIPAYSERDNLFLRPLLSLARAAAKIAKRWRCFGI